MSKLENMTEPQLKKLMLDCAHALDFVIQKQHRIDGRPQWVLVVFNDPKVGQYISSCERESMIKAMKETVWRLENKEDIPR